jgi:hypothetical protein
MGCQPTIILSFKWNGRQESTPLVSRVLLSLSISRPPYKIPIISIKMTRGAKIERDTMRAHSHKDDDVKELLLAEMGREDGIKDVLEEDELSNGLLSEDEKLDKEVVGIFSTDHKTDFVKPYRL